MAIAKKCDICGKLYESYNMPHNSKLTNGLMFLNIDDHQKYYSNQIMDCCPRCMSEIRLHIESLKNDGMKGERR